MEDTYKVKCKGDKTKNAIKYSSVLKIRAEDTKLILVYLITLLHYLFGLINSSGSQRSRTASRVCTLLTGAY